LLSAQVLADPRAGTALRCLCPVASYAKRWRVAIRSARIAHQTRPRLTTWAEARGSASTPQVSPTYPCRKLLRRPRWRSSYLCPPEQLSLAIWLPHNCQDAGPRTTELEEPYPVPTSVVRSPGLIQQAPGWHPRADCGRAAAFPQPRCRVPP